MIDNNIFTFNTYEVLSKHMNPTESKDEELRGRIGHIYASVLCGKNTMYFYREDGIIDTRKVLILDQHGHNVLETDSYFQGGVDGLCDGILRYFPSAEDTIKSAKVTFIGASWYVESKAEYMAVTAAMVAVFFCLYA